MNKRTANGYVSNFVFLKTPFGKIEMQLQSQHENIEGSYGYPAHGSMNDDKKIKPFKIPQIGDTKKLEEFRTYVDFVSPKKFLAQFDSSEPNRIITQIFGAYQNYKSIMIQVQRDSKKAGKMKDYFKKLYSRRYEIFSEAGKSEDVESFIEDDIDEYLKSEEFNKLMKDSGRNIEER